MPIYVYQASNPEQSCDYCGKGFEIVQSIRTEPLLACPECKNPVHRIIQAVGIHIGTKALLADKNLSQHGFTKLVNEGGGKFRKTT